MPSVNKASDTMQQDEAASTSRMPPAAARPALPVPGTTSPRLGAAERLVSMACAPLLYASCMQEVDNLIPVANTGSRGIFWDASPILPNSRTEGRGCFHRHAADARDARRPHQLQ